VSIIIAMRSLGKNSFIHFPVTGFLQVCLRGSVCLFYLAEGSMVKGL